MLPHQKESKRSPDERKRHPGFPLDPHIAALMRATAKGQTGISRFRVRCFASPRNDGGEKIATLVDVDALRLTANLSNPIKLMLPVQSQRKKYFPSRLPQITSISLAIPCLFEGAFRDRHGRWRGMRWTQAALLTRARFLRTAKSCGPDVSTLASSSQVVTCGRR
jgi:hypothetical protein